MNPITQFQGTGKVDDQDQQVGQTVILPGQTPEGQYILSALVKRTYDISPNNPCTRADTDRDLVSGDRHYADPMNSTVQFESDFVPFKPATDIVLNGKIYTSHGVPAQMLLASLGIGDFRKDIQVIGDRVCHYRKNGSNVFSEPESFTEIQLRYEQAYGGVDVYSDLQMPCMYPRNHLGTGFVIADTKAAVDNLKLPNFEDPKCPITPDNLCVGDVLKWENQPMPQGFGWFCKYWQPRAKLAGVLPADKPFERELRKLYTPAVPAEQQEQYAQTQLPDMDFRFFNGASPGLVLPYLNGDEHVSISNMSTEGQLDFLLPADPVCLGFDIGKGVKEPKVVLQTVMIRMDDGQIDMVWRGAIPYDGPDSLPKLNKIEVNIK